MLISDDDAGRDGDGGDDGDVHTSHWRIYTTLKKININHSDGDGDGNVDVMVVDGDGASHTGGLEDGPLQ